MSLPTPQQKQQKDAVVNFLIIYSLLVSLGFPGNYSKIFGSALATLFEYSAFLAEIVIIILSSGDRLLEFTLIAYDSRDKVSYFLIAEIFVVSMSVARSFSGELIACSRFAVTGFYGLWITDHYDIEESLELLNAAQTVFVFFSILLLVIKPSTAMYSNELVSNAFRGLFSTKNPAAAELSCMVIFQTILFKIKVKRNKPVPRWQLFCYILQWGLLVICRASGALVTAVGAVFYILFLSKYRFPVGWVYVIGNVGWLVFALNFIPMIAPMLEAMGKDASLTGRIPMWNVVVEFMMKNKTLTGTGYGRFWVEPKDYTRIQAHFPPNSFWGNAVAGAHNCILELWLNCGLLGIGAFFLAILYSTRKIDELSDECYITVSSFFLYMLIGGLTERIYDNFHFRTLFLFIIMGMACRRRPLERRLFSWQLAKLEQEKQSEEKTSSF